MISHNFLVDEIYASLISHEHRLSITKNSSIEQAFKTQVSIGQGRGIGRSNTIGRGRIPHRGGRKNPSSSNRRSGTQNPSKISSQNQAQG